MNILIRKKSQLLVIATCILTGALAFGVYRYVALTQKFELLQTKVDEAATAYEEEIKELETTRTELEGQLAHLSDENEELLDDLRDKRREVEEFDDRIAAVTEGLGTIQNTIATDPELLRKYSRVYFLSENYKPAALSEINTDYTYAGKEHLIHSKIKPYLEEMIEDAIEDEVDILVASAYRSFDEQSELKDYYTVVFGAGTANQFSAEQGYSEHQLGTTVDFTTLSTLGDIDVFAPTEAYEWLTDNAYKYGFILSYPEGNNFYQYEPWHWRFVGKELAEDLHDDRAYFYDWDQRDIDAYRPNFFE